MIKPTIINIDDTTSNDELHLIKACGFPLVQVARRDLLTQSLPSSNQPVNSFGMLRTTRLEREEYLVADASMRQSGIQLRNSPHVSGLLSDFALHYPLISDLSPRAFVFASNVHPEHIINTVRAAGVSGGIFIKTERKSLKGDSMIQSVTVEAVARCLTALNSAFAPFERLIVKEVIPLESVDHRAIVIGTHIVGFDTGPHVGDQHMTSSAVFEFVYSCVASLARQGLVGDYVIDVARRTDNKAFVVVEIKDLQFTQLKNPRTIWPEIARALITL
jgi:hypothetical protein